MVPKLQIEVGKLRYIAQLYAESAEPEDRIRANDVTDIVYAEIDDRIEHHELFNAQFIGQTTSGKSTAAMALTWYILRRMGKPFVISRISGDQIEYLRFISNPDVDHTCQMIDEWNELGETGLNATTESAKLQYYSDVQAQRYIHKIACSPKTIIDPNSDVIFDVISRDDRTKMTYVLVSFRLSTANGEFIQLVGHMKIDVSKVMALSVHVQYREKKFKKMALVNREGVRDIREFGQAKVIMAVFKELRSMAAVMTPSKDVESTYVDKIRREARELYSILTVEEIIRKVHGLLMLERTIQGIRKQVARIEEKDPDDRSLAGLRTSLEGLQVTQGVLIDNYYRLIKTGEEYANI